MTTLLILALAFPAVIGSALIVYRTERRTDHLSRIPLGFGEHDHRPPGRGTAGPDAARIDAELDTLLRHRRDDD